MTAINHILLNFNFIVKQLRFKMFNTDNIENKMINTKKVVL